MSNDTPISDERLADVIRVAEGREEAGRREGLHEISRELRLDALTALRELQSLRASAAKAGEGVCNCDAGCDKCDPAGAAFRDPEQRRRIEEKLLGPDCAPSPEQQSKSVAKRIAAQKGEGYPFEQQGAEQHEDWREFHDFLQHRLIARNREYGESDQESKRLKEQLARVAAYLRTAPAPALGLTADEIEACRVGAAGLRGDMASMRRIIGDEAVHHHAYKQIADAESTLRSMLERGGR
jgi:hypothetical protein